MMKRPDIETIFGPVSLNARDAAGRLLKLFLDEFDGYLSTYYARMKYDLKKDTFFFWDEEMTLRDREDLLQRVERDRGGRWYCNLNLGFYPAEVKPALFSDPPDGPGVTLLVSINSGLTKFLEESARPRVPFVLFLIRIAQAIGAPWFLAGIELEHWKALRVDRFMDRERLPPRTYVVGWRHDALDEQALISGLGLQGKEVERTTYGYKFVTFFPAP
jgi:hypothetical protein